MSSMQKMFTGPMHSRNCQSCGKGVYITWKYTLWIVAPLILLLFVARLVKLDAAAILLLGIPAAIGLSLVQIYLVPLSKDKIDEKL